MELFNEAIVFGWKAPGRRVYVEASWLAESCRRHHSTEAAARAVSPRFFATPHEFAAWLDANAATEEELLIGFYTRSSARASMTWVESVDEVLCVGWIDGVRKNIDEHAYQIRFTPRKPGSTWSAKNIERVRVLGEQGRMRAAGLTAFSFRRETKSRIYSYEQSEQARLSSSDEALFRRDNKAWNFSMAQPPGYRHLVIWRIVSAKRAATRETRLAALIEASHNGQRLG